jgi:hypothetical protein
MKHDGIALRYGNTELTPTLTNGIFLWLTQRNGMMDCEQIKVRWEALKSAWDALNGPEAFPGEHYAHEDDVQAAMEAVENDVDALLAAIDELEVRNAKLEAVAKVCREHVHCANPWMPWTEDDARAVRGVTKALDAIDRVLALHQKVRSQSLCGPGDFCVEDGRSWPCETVRALEP